MNDHAFWPGTKMLRSVAPHEGAEDARASTNERGTTTTIDLLNRALSIARIGAMRCEWQYFAALRNHSPALAAAALEHANEALVHAERIAERIVKLGKKPDALPESAARGKEGNQRDGNSLVMMISPHLAADRATINSYREIATLFESLVPASQKLIDDIVSAEEACAGHLADVLDEASTQKREEI